MDKNKSQKSRKSVLNLSNQKNTSANASNKKESMVELDQIQLERPPND